MKTIRSSFFLPMLMLLPAFSPARAEWEKTDDTVAWKSDGQVLWKFCFGQDLSKPYFHPIALKGGDPLTTLSPPDHLHHYGLWFSWKYINHVNYWELDKKTGKSVGPTKWNMKELVMAPDGSAVIAMEVRYVSPSNETQTLLAEQREIKVSAQRPDGGVTIDWTAKFTAGDEELLLDRTHMPGEPGGAVNGGYAGFSMRVAQDPVKVEFVTAEGPVEKFESDRARPNSKAAAANITQNGRTDGAAILSHASNLGGDSPWYMINSKAMRWFSPALIAPAAKKVAPHESFTWKFRVITKSGPWDPALLKGVSDEFNK